MKKLNSGIIGLFILVASCNSSFAIEGLHLSIQSSNAVLSWPSVDDGSETYIIRYRPTLNATSSWLTLTDYLPPDSSTNITFFVHSNSVQYPPVIAGGTNGGGGGTPDPTATNNASGGTNSFAFQSTTGFYQVVRDGAHLFGLTNGTVLSGIVHLPIELANGSGTVSTMSLTEDDSPVGNSIQTAPLTSPSALIVDTTMMSNGVHQISASARWDDTNGGLWEADSPPISVTISNEISFENWMPTFGETGNTFLFRATSAHANTDWVVSVYDSSNTYLGYFSGHTDDGDISFYYDYSGTSLTNNPVFSFEIATEYVDPPTPKIFKRLEQWSGSGAWVAVAQHAWDNFSGSEQLYAELSGFIGGAKQVNWQVNPPASEDENGNWDAYGLAFGSENPQGTTDWANFRQALYDSRSRNLVYFGHGGPNGIGYDSSSTNRYISAAEIASRLHTIPAGQTNSHSFRFVFLDGCSTAKGTLPEAFNIFHRENVQGWEYADASLRYSAFVGWPKDKAIGFGVNNGTITYNHVNFITGIQTDMLLNGHGIKDAIHYGATQPGVSGYNDDSMKVYGYWLLTFGLDNY